MTTTLKDAQLVALQSIWTQYARRYVMVPRDQEREARLEWASKNCGREISSFKDLTKDEARKLIDLLKTAVGQQPGGKPKLRRDQARRAGLDGRRGSAFSPQLASADDLATIESFYQRLGWDRARFDAWLRSDRSPLAKKVNGVRVAPANAEIRTSSDANRVRWALKGMLAARGLWK